MTAIFSFVIAMRLVFNFGVFHFCCIFALSARTPIYTVLKLLKGKDVAGVRGRRDRLEEVAWRRHAPHHNGASTPKS